MTNKYDETMKSFESMTEDERLKIIIEKMESLEKKRSQIPYAKSQSAKYKMTPEEKTHESEVIQNAILEVIKTGDFGSFKFE